MFSLSGVPRIDRFDVRPMQDCVGAIDGGENRNRKFHRIAPASPNRRADGSPLMHHQVVSGPEVGALGAG
jgi:hypothetical protein